MVCTRRYDSCGISPCSSIGLYGAYTWIVSIYKRCCSRESKGNQWHLLLDAGDTHYCDQWHWLAERSINKGITSCQSGKTGLTQSSGNLSSEYIKQLVCFQSFVQWRCSQSAYTSSSLQPPPRDLSQFWQLVSRQVQLSGTLRTAYLTMAFVRECLTKIPWGHIALTASDKVHTVLHLLS